MADSETIVKALEISIALTKADHTWLRTDERGFIFLKEPLFSTMETVSRLINASGLVNRDGDIRVFPEDGDMVP